MSVLTKRQVPWSTIGMRFQPPASADPQILSEATGRSGHPPTDEQQDIIDAYMQGGHLVIEALAGAGKTTTLKMLAACHIQRPGTYIVYNKSAQMEAAGQFPQAVNVATAHSLAYRAVGHRYADRLPGRGKGNPRIPAKDIAQRLKVTPVHTGKNLISAVQRVRLAEATINRFCLSDAQQPTRAHLPEHARHLGPIATVADVILPIADQIWRDITNPRGVLYFTHDHYLKIWQTGNPVIGGDYILFDEAQDANPVIAAVVAAQNRSQKIYVGDRNQQLYAWRGAVDALEHLQGWRLPLTRSFRFGPEIAAEANRWLQLLGSDLKVVGAGPQGRIEAIGDLPDAILCRGNGTAIEQIIDLQGKGIPVALAPGDRTAGNDIRSFAFAARDLQAGRGTDHPELSAFRTWTDLCEYADQEENGADLKRMITIINRVGVGRVLDAIRDLTPKEHARVTVSTAHKSKGLEWDRVKVASDFAPPEEGDEADPADLMLAYVTVTRAKRQLDPGSLNPSDWA